MLFLFVVCCLLFVVSGLEEAYRVGVDAPAHLCRVDDEAQLRTDNILVSHIQLGIPNRSAETMPPSPEFFAVRVGGK